MANTVTIRKLQDGKKNVVLHVYVASDGASGELADQVLADISTFLDTPTKVRLLEIWWALTGFTARLEFDRTADSPLMVLFQGDEGHLSFENIGGIQDTGTGDTGDVTVTTTGFTAAGDEGVIILRLAKD
jgi:hypothetical protein